MSEGKAVHPDAMRCGSSVFRWGERTYVMGVVNVSPDSFSGDGITGVEDALNRARALVSDGADIIDVGGESTRPASEPLSIKEELERVIPVVERLAHDLPVPISVDTYKLEVARQALKAGASMINDIWGLKKAPGLARLAADNGVPIVLMSNQRGSECRDIVPAVISDLERAVDEALSAGVLWENILIDPGIGFGKTQEQNLEILRRIDELRALDRPVLLGTSRKSFIGWVLDLMPEQRSGDVAFVPPGDRRLEGTAATIAIGVAGGVDMVRVHDVKEMARVCRMSDAIVRGI
jgi:dihydropteroate synthase